MSALEKFGLATKATPEEVKAEWRRLASIHHPDKGGDAVEFSRLIRLYKAAHAEASAPKPCPQCLGTGKVKQSHGFSSIDLPCAACGGSGHA
jgi:DnaJ-class molecular chaperone